MPPGAGGRGAELPVVFFYGQKVTSVNKFYDLLAIFLYLLPSAYSVYLRATKKPSGEGLRI